ncbi:TetR/AcrR family transcriptional regulator [Xylanimonas sp. McL0601]|uniref:TetR/AcrR family transcriptional regulator n=1 Tax=Xylanimonas sp. McL0601 TaxID=3414739 RepID=UPI003CEC0136
MNPIPPPGLREQKKQQTRTAIMDAALELFIGRGFTVVTVAEVARAARVSEATVFNYFRTKEDLVHDRLDEFWVRVVDAIENRPDGTGTIDAIESFLLAQPAVAPDTAARERLLAITRMITDSPSLLAREGVSYTAAAAALSAVLARTTAIGDDAAAAAQAILGIQRSLVDRTRELVLAGIDAETLNRDVAERTRSGYAMLRNGLKI